MHELAITQEVIAIASDRAGGARIVRIVLEIGKLSAVLPDAVRFCFDLCSEGTAAESAALEIIEVPGKARCRECQKEIELNGPLDGCACGSVALEWLAGADLVLKALEVA
jgi:hydrogenase nickel incorporation protein HypA/HybF